MAEVGGPFAWRRERAACSERSIEVENQLLFERSSFSVRTCCGSVGEKRL